MKCWGSNGCRSSMVSPTPTYWRGILRVSQILIAIPPLAVPSNFVRAMPVIPIALWNKSAWDKAFWPVVASRINRISWGASGSFFESLDLDPESGIFSKQPYDGEYGFYPALPSHGQCCQPAHGRGRSGIPPDRSP